MAAAVERQRDLASLDVPLSESAMRRQRRKKLRAAIMEAKLQEAKVNGNEDADAQSIWQTPMKNKTYQTERNSTPCKLDKPLGLYLPSTADIKDGSFEDTASELALVRLGLEELTASLCTKLYDPDLTHLPTVEEAAHTSRPYDHTDETHRASFCDTGEEESCAVVMEELSKWRCMHQYFYEPMIEITPDMLRFLSEAEMNSLAESEVATIKVLVEGVIKIVLAPSCVDLHHVERALARHFQVQHHMLTVGALVYNSADDDECILVGDAYRFSLELHRLTEDPIEAELRDLERNWLGYLFTYQRHAFWKKCGDVSPDTRRELVEFGLAHPPSQVSEDLALSRSNHESAYFNHEEIASAWQYEYEDNGEDDSDLLSLMRLLRRAIAS